MVALVSFPGLLAQWLLGAAVVALPRMFVSR
jgi:hypothetical protein